MSEIERIVEQLRQGHEGEAWHGPSLGEALEGVTAAGATRRPIGAAHSIWEIVSHVCATDGRVRAQMTGEKPGEEADWPPLTKTDEAAWRKAVAELKATLRGLRDAVAKLPEGRLHQVVPGQAHSHWHLLLGSLHHDLYHAGQISLLKKGL